MAASIHPTALIDAAAKIADDVKIGPYCVVGPNVTLGSGVILASHVCIAGITTIGARTRLAPFVSLGGPPQSTAYRGEDTTLRIGSNCDIREHVTINTGTVGGGGQTIVGDRVMMMVASHIGHDCIVGNDVIFANNATLGGHCEVGDRAVIGGFAGCHQFSRIGQNAMIGAVVGVREDVIPFGLVDRHSMLGGLNIVGLKRRGATKSDLKAIRAIVREIFFGAGTFEERKQQAIANPPENEFGAIIIDFIAKGGKRPLMKFGRGVAMGAADFE